MPGKVTIFFGFLLVVSTILWTVSAGGVTGSDANCCVYAKIALATTVIAAFSVLVLVYSACPECGASGGGSGGAAAEG